MPNRTLSIPGGGSNFSAGQTSEAPGQPEEGGSRARLVKWGVVLLAGLTIAAIPPPSGITPESWRLLAIFVATITGSILRPAPGGAVVLLGVSALAFFGVMPVGQALEGYSNPIVWLVLAAFFISRGMIKTGLGRRIALLFIRAIGHRSFGLGYALVGTDMVLASVIPSNGARAGGIIFPIAKSLSEAYDSRPGTTAGRLGAYLMCLLYQCDVIICAIFLTGQAANPLIAELAKQVTGIEVSYTRWLAAAIVPGVVSLLVVPPLLFRLFPPEVRRTPEARDFAAAELKRMGPPTRSEKLMMLVFGLVALLWMTKGLHGVNYEVVALLGICVLLLTRVIGWDDVLSERNAWDVFIWYGGLVRMAEALGQTGITKRFADSTATLTVGWKWWTALGVLLFVYFYAHYGFASITAQATAMYIPFLVVILGAGAPTYLAVLSLAYFSNLSASLTHYGTTPAPIYFGAGYVKQRTWWWLGLVASLPNIVIWVVIGFSWWKLLGLW
jgi:divalent anion:Na+ symporter, DASS family